MERLSQDYIGTVFSVGWAPCRAVKAGECYMVRGDFCQDAQVDPMKRRTNQQI